MSGIIPVEPGDPEQKIDIALGDATYHLRIRWNTRADLWFLDVYEVDGKTPVALGLALVLGSLLGRTSTHVLFSGGLFLVDDSGTGAEAGLHDLGGRVTLWYLEPDDLVLAGTPLIEAPPP